VLGRRPSRARDAGDARRSLNVDDVGDPSGAVVVYLHGGGDSRLSRHPDDSIAASLGVRLIAVDRCGAAVPRRSLRSCAHEVIAVLPDGPFSVVGWSAGGPHALAVAALAGSRVRRVALVGSMPRPELVTLLPPTVRRAMRVSRFAPRVASRGLEAWGRRPPPPTGDPLTDAAYARGRVESFRNGGLWLARELAYLGRPWGFSLSEVQAPVTLWWGDEDDVCPPAIAEDYAALLPESELRIVPGTHQLLFSRWRDILAELTR
jgi:pimeloyl-ACP methyl ester carboxylesterase